MSPEDKGYFEKLVTDLNKTVGSVNKLVEISNKRDDTTNKNIIAYNKQNELLVKLLGEFQKTNHSIHNRLIKNQISNLEESSDSNRLSELNYLSLQVGLFLILTNQFHMMNNQFMEYLFVVFGFIVVAQYALKSHSLNKDLKARTKEHEVSGKA